MSDETAGGPGIGPAPDQMPYEPASEPEAQPTPPGRSGGVEPPALGVPGRYREITVAAVVLGLVLGLIMNASITYAGLKIGFTLAGSAISAVLGFGILKAMRRGTILETNIVQTIGSSVNTSNSGVIFTFPVLFLLGFSIDWNGIDFWRIALAASAGAVLGAAFIIPLRKQMIDIDRLRFPTGTGVATILKSPGAGAKKAVVLLAGIAVSAALYLPTVLAQIDFWPLEADTRDELVEKLDDQYDRERIGEAGIAQTLAIWDLIEAREAPPSLVERGRLVAALKASKRSLEDAKDAASAARKADDSTAIADATAAIVAARSEIETQAQALADASELEATAADGAVLSDDLAEQVFRVVTGAPEAEGKEAPDWESLRNPKFGYAASRLWGYQDLNLRLRPYYERNSDEIITDNDHDHDGRPDQYVTDDKFYFSRLLGLPGEFELIFGIAPFALGAGFISGRPGFMVLAGGLLAYFVINPIAFSMGWLPQSIDAHEAPGVMFQAVNRPLGIGMLLGGALMGVASSLPSIGAALKSMVAPKAKTTGGKTELGFGVLIPVILIGAGALFLAADNAGSSPINPTCPVTAPAGEIAIDTSVDPASYKGYAIGFADDAAAATWENEWTDVERDAFLTTLNAKPGLLAGLDPHLRAAIIALIGVLWIWFAGIIIAQCTGLTDWSPISGLALLTVVLVLLLAGSGAVVGAVMLGAALCVAITLAADMMSDLKTGYLVGSKPAKQQIAELSLVWIGPAVSMGTVLLIVAVTKAKYGVPLGPGTDIPAPQADALRAVIEGVQGGDVPYALYAGGAVLGVLLGLGSFAGLGVLVGLSVYLPFYYIATYGIGCVANIVLAATKGKRFVEEWGVPLAAGLIVGEGIIALTYNIFILAGENLLR
ncbi:MAG: hypothetical protein CMJ31_10005 [Phycisphaerae bacterium]|nr:hypothetical protein [Phycisphaerae bacterium]